MKGTMKIIKILAHIMLTLAFVAYIAYQFRTDPMGILAGKRLSGDEYAYPADWAFSNNQMLIAVETRPGNPHSVTTICFLHEGNLYVPARDGSEKDWPQYVLADPRARIKMDDRVYRVTLHRETTWQREELLPSILKKYPGITSSPETTGDLWLFRVAER